MDALDIFLMAAAFVMCLVMLKARINELKQEAIYHDHTSQILPPEHNLSLPKETCIHCGAPMETEEIFCASCMKITPRVQEMLDTYPDRQPHEFLSFSEADRTDFQCPHCHAGNIHQHTEYVHTPIICCPACHEYFLSTSIPEPYLNLQPSKYIDLLTRIINGWLVILAVSFVIHLPKWLWFLITAAYTILQYRNYPKENLKRYQDSKHRVDANPSYIQILADMGYLPKISPEFHSMIVGYGQDAECPICEYCGSKNPPEETFCAFCTAPLPKPYRRKYVHPITYNMNHAEQTWELILKLILEICGIVVYFAQWTFS